MPINTEVIVVGGGAIGAACTRELARAGRRVLLIERGSDEGASWRAAAGMLAPQIEAAEADPLFELAVAGRERYVRLAEELLATTGVDIQFWRSGIVRLATQASDVAPLKSRVKWQQHGGHAVEWLEANVVQAKWPWLGASLGALWAPGEAALDPSRLVRALLDDAKLGGAAIQSDQVVSVETRNNRVVAVIGANQRYSADHVVIAAGAWAPAISGLPRPLPVVPVRGQMAAFPWPPGIERGIVFGSQVYVVARGAEAIVGSTMEHAGFDARVTDEGRASICREARELFPPLRGAEPTRVWAGLRPMSPDGRPILGSEPLCQGLWYATGHGRNGILLGAITGLIIAQLINGVDPGWDLGPMQPARFFSW